MRCLSLALCTVAALLLTSCGGGGNTVTADETSDPLYQQAQDFKKQGRNGEALSAFLREIDRRGESGAPESHLEAALLYLNFSREPVEAYHHFGKYLELRPNDQRARGMKDAAKREIARVLLAPPSDQSIQLQTNDEIDQLRRRVQELEAENQALRGGGAVAATTRNPPLISLADAAPAPATQPPVESPLTPAPLPAPTQAVPRSAASQPTSSSFRPPNGSPGQSLASTPTTRPNPTPTRSGTVASRPTAPQRPGASAGGRSYTVQRGDTPYALARKFYGSADNAKVRGIIDANADVLHGSTELKPGMVLRIP